MKRTVIFLIIIIACQSSRLSAGVSVRQRMLPVVSQVVLSPILDNFNDGADPNLWGGTKGTGTSDPSATLNASYNSANAFGGTGYCLKLDYNVPNAGNVAGLYMPLKSDWSGVNVTTYSYISVMLKGTGPGKSLKLQLVSSDNANNSVYTINYSTLTVSWQEIKVPFSAFASVDVTKLSQINFIFEHDYFAGKGYPVSGTVYMDNMIFKFN